MKARGEYFGCGKALLLCLYLVFALGSPDKAREHPACGSESLELPAHLRVQRQYAPRALAAASGEAIREIDTVIVVPSEFNTDPETGSAANSSPASLIEEIGGAIALANEYLREAKVRIKPVEYQFHQPDSDPYRVAALRRDAYAMLETATRQWESYTVPDYNMVLVLGRGSYNGTFGLAYPAVSCLSKRYSVVFATQGGSGPAKEVAFSHTIAHEVGHFLGMNHDRQVYSLGHSLMWPTYLNKPFGFSSLSLREAELHAGYGRPGSACLRAVAQDGDLDGDGVSDEEELRGGSNPRDPGSHIQSLKSPVYTAWNSFLGMVNILELVNPAAKPKTVALELISMHGQTLHARTIELRAQGQTDIILNDIAGFTPDSYGLLKISFEGSLDGRMSFYRNGAVASEEFQFAFSIPMRNPQFGTSVVAFNTYQPSQAPERRNEIVANWLTLVNLGEQAERFKITSYDMGGTPLRTTTITIPGGGRRDVDGGHGFAGGSSIGLHQIIPMNQTTPYIAELVRYGSSPGGYDFAFPLLAKSGNGEVTVVPISVNDDQNNWVEVANALHRPIDVHLEFFSAGGEPLAQIDVALKAFEQRHYDASGLLRTMKEESGYVVLAPSEANALVAQSMVYYRDAGDETISAMYGTQAIEPLGAVLSGSYNLFLGVENVLTLINNASVPTSARVVLERADSVSEINVALPANGSARVPLYTSAALGAERETYGLLKVEPQIPGSIAAELIRLRTRGALTDLAIPTAVR